MAMLLTIDFSSDQPIYMQLRDGVVAGIASGALKDGDSLPSVRSLAAEASVNLHTVGKAYTLLKSEGFIDILRNKGAVVRTGKLKEDTGKFFENVKTSLQPIISEAVTRGVPRQSIVSIIDELYNELGGATL
jgi:DNA-binding transcriptional regulator YhcF (GntR family)